MHQTQQGNSCVQEPTARLPLHLVHLAHAHTHTGHRVMAIFTLRLSLTVHGRSWDIRVTEYKDHSHSPHFPEDALSKGLARTDDLIRCTGSQCNSSRPQEAIHGATLATVRIHRQRRRRKIFAASFPRLLCTQCLLVSTSLSARSSPARSRSLSSCLFDVLPGGWWSTGGFCAKALFGIRRMRSLSAHQQQEGRNQAGRQAVDE